MHEAQQPLQAPRATTGGCAWLCAAGMWLTAARGARPARKSRHGSTDGCFLHLRGCCVICIIAADRVE